MPGTGRRPVKVASDKPDSVSDQAKQIADAVVEHLDGDAVAVIALGERSLHVLITALLKSDVETEILDELTLLRDQTFGATREDVQRRNNYEVEFI